MSSSAARSATSASVASTVRWPGSVPRSTTAAGSVGRPAGGDQLLGDPRQRADAHVEDERAGEARRARASRARVSGLSGSSWPVTKATALASVAVRDRDPGVGGRGDARGDAGHDLEGDAGLAQGGASSPPRPNTNGSPPLSRTTRLPARACSTSRALVSSCGIAGRRPPCRRRRARRPARACQRRGGDQAVVEDHVGRRDQLERAHGEQARVARARADEADHARVMSPRRLRLRPRRRSPAPAAQHAFGATSRPERLGVAALPPIVAHPLRPVGQPGEAAIERLRRARERADRACGNSPRAPGSTRARPQAAMRRLMATRRRRHPRRRVVGAGLDRERALARRRDEDLASSAPPARRGGPSRSSPAAASTSASPSPSASLRSRVSTLPRRSTTSRSWRGGEQLGAAAAARGADAGALRAARRASARRRARRAGRRARGRRRCAGPAASSPGRPWPSARRGRSRPPAARASSAPIQRDLSPRARSASPAVVISTSSHGRRAPRPRPRLGQRERAAARPDPQRGRQRRRAAPAPRRGSSAPLRLGRPASLEPEQLAQRAACARGVLGLPMCFSRSVGSCSSRFMTARASASTRSRSRVGQRSPSGRRSRPAAARRSSSPCSRSAATVGSTSSWPSQPAKRLDLLLDDPLGARAPRRARTGRWRATAAWSASMS